mmetsp:Transcript_115665/g.160503  ORF Transcript_115665/g.160503 Transcript_115665/m.160503 type:complete len:86 (-) Transcript_115665:475-732(-)
MVIETVALTVAVVCGVTCFLMAAEHDQEVIMAAEHDQKAAMARAAFVEDSAEKAGAADDDDARSEGSTVDSADGSTVDSARLKDD